MSLTKSLAIVLVCAIVLCCSVYSVNADSAADDAAWANFKAKYNKSYRDDNEDTYRKNIFLENVANITALNEQDPHAEYAISEFSDLTQDQFSNRFLMKIDMSTMPDEPVDARRHARSQQKRNTGTPPASYDWRTVKAVSAVKNQGACGSCWAFSAAEAIESQRFLNNPNRLMLLLSPQQIVDCDTSDWGCGGGWPGTAFNYIIKAGGIMTNKTYPYTSASNAVAGNCKKSSGVLTKLTSWAYSSKAGALNEAQMLSDLWEYGPLSVCLSADNWTYYRGGIFSLATGTSLDHCVQLVGWGTASGVPYWTLRNQWGTSFGENGYIRIKRGTNACLIANYAIRPIGAAP